MKNAYLKICCSAAATMTMLVAGYAQGAQALKVAGINEYILSGSNLRASAKVDGQRNLFAPAANVNGNFVSNLAYTGRVVDGVNGTGKKSKFFEMRVVGQQKRLFVAQSRVPRSTQRDLLSLHNTGVLKRTKGGQNWRCSSAENLDLPENQMVRQAFSPQAFPYNKIFKSRNAVLQPDNATNHKVEIMLTTSGEYKFRRRGEKSFSQVKMAYCSDGRLQVARFKGSDGHWKHFTLGQVGKNQPLVNTPAVAAPSRPTVVVPVQPPNSGSALPNPVATRKTTVLDTSALQNDANLPVPTNF